MGHSLDRSGSTGSRSAPRAWCCWGTRTTGRSCAACPRCPRPRSARSAPPRPIIRARPCRPLPPRRPRPPRKPRRPIPPAPPAPPDRPARRERGPAPRHAMAGAAAQAAQPVAPDLLPSVDRRPTARMKLPAKALRIGREPDNDVILSDLNVSRHHAELRKSPTGSYEIVDLGSHNGTFVNGQPVSSQMLTEQDLVSVGNSTFRLKDGELRQFVDEGNITFTAQDLVVKVGGRQDPAEPRHVPDPGEMPARRHRPQRRGQVDAARRADRHAPRGHRRPCSTTTETCTRTTPSSATGSAWSRRKACCTPS